MAVKQLQPRVEIKDEDKGQVELVFSRFNVIDKDNDVTVPGAFDDMHGKKVPVSAYGHMSWEGKLPVGVAKIKQYPSEARAEAQFFMDTQHGADTFRTVKRLHTDGIGDWSYGYDPKEFSFGEFKGQRVRFLQKLGVQEVSPVLVGAGVNTRTLSAKGAPDDDEQKGRRVGYRGIIRPHETDTSDDRWVPDDVLKAFGLTTDVTAFRKSYAWHNPADDPSMAASYAFLHHDEKGAANVRACLIGISALNGAKHAPAIDDETDRKAIYDHLAGHLRDADFPVPDLRTGTEQLKMNDEALVVLADLTAFTQYAMEVGASRRARGKGLTRSTETILGWISEELRAIQSTVDDPNAGLENIFLQRIRDNLHTGS